jgi:glycosyltransferase involved in cell wall biosynthesis
MTIRDDGCVQAQRVGFCGFHTGTGGMGHVMINLINGYAEAGYQVDLMMADASGRHLGELDSRINLVETGSSFLFSCLPGMIRYLRECRPGYVISNRENSNRCLALAKMLTGSPTRIVFRVGNSMTSTLAKRHFLKRWLRRAGIRWSYQRADLVIVNSAKLADDVAQHAGIPASRIKILKNPTFSKDLLLKAQEPVDHPWFREKTVPVILGVGRLTRQKDFPTLIRAVALVRRTRPVKLVILGEGNDRGLLQRLIAELALQDDVALAGYVDNPFPFMARADLFVLSSAWEGSPNVLIQALSLGCPVTATDCPEGPREILQGGRVAPLVKVGDVEGLAREIIRTLDDPPGRAAMQAAAVPFEAGACVKAYMEAIETF